MTHDKLTDADFAALSLACAVRSLTTVELAIEQRVSVEAARARLHKLMRYSFLEERWETRIDRSHRVRAYAVTPNGRELVASRGAEVTR